MAGSGKASRIFPQIIQSDLYKQIKSKYYFTRYPGHASELVKKVISETDNDINGVIVIGGDGTLHEVVNGLEGARIPSS